MKAGFLKEEGTFAPITPRELEAQLQHALVESERLRSVADPDTEPFRSRYEERALLKKLSQQAHANAQANALSSEARSRAMFVEAAAKAMLGANFMDTEETGQARGLLEGSLSVISEVSEAHSLTIDTLNRLAVLAANREEHQLSLQLLERALKQYESACQQVTAYVQALDVSESAGAPDNVAVDAAGAAKEARKLEDLHTLTGYYLAQAYGNCGQAAESAHWCQRTMERQLRNRGSGRQDDYGFKAHEWARNASTLSAYFCAENQFAAAEACLHAADAVLKNRRAEEKARLAALASEVKTRATDGSDGTSSEGEVAAFSKPRNYMTRIGAEAIAASNLPDEAKHPAAKVAHGRPVTLSGTQVDDPTPGIDPLGSTTAVAQLPEEELEAAAQLDIAFVEFWISLLHALAGGEQKPAASQTVSFEGIRLPKPHPATSLDENFRTPEVAREVYRLGAAHAARAKAFFVLDGFVTDHCTILSLESSLLRELMAFEPQLTRRLAMHKRRAELLQLPLRELNENAYVQIYRQALFDMATIRSDMLELRTVQLEDEPEQRRNAKLAPFVADAIAAHTEFLRRLDKDGKPPDKVDDESAHAYVNSRLSLSRAHSRIPSAASLAEALSQMEIVSTFLKANNIKGMEEEVKVCDEMIQLLPLRIADLNKREAAKSSV